MRRDALIHTADSSLRRSASAMQGVLKGSVLIAEVDIGFLCASKRFHRMPPTGSKLRRPVACGDYVTSPVSYNFDELSGATEDNFGLCTRVIRGTSDYAELQHDQPPNCLAAST